MADGTGGPSGSPPDEALTILDFRPRTVALGGLAVLAVAVVLGAFRAAPTTLTHIAIGVILALALDPLVVQIRNRLHWRRATAVAVVVVVVGGLFAAVLAVMGPPAIRQARQFATELPETVREMYDFPIVGERLQDADAAEQVREWAAELPTRIDQGTITRIVDSLVGGLAAMATVLLVAVAILIDGDALVRRARRLVPPPRRVAADRMGAVFYEVIGRYFAGSLLVAGIAGMFVLAVGLALGVPLAPVAALWVFITDLIPQVGGFLGGVFFVTLAVTQSVTVGIIAAALFIAYLNVENHILQPAIVGERVDLSPPTTMLAALVGGAAAGVPGALVATPLVGTVKKLYLEYRPDEVGDDAARTDGDAEGSSAPVG